jgi:DNA-binding transcriptional ArsR family regulator
MDISAELSVIKKKALLLKALSNPIRLCIVRELLQRDACNVSSMQNCLQMSQSTVSQHLGRLRDLGIINGERKGTEVYYRVISNEAAEIIKVLFNNSK